MIALIDGDLVAFRCAISAENDPEAIAFIRSDLMIRDILAETEASEYKIFVNDNSKSFRKVLDPEYKANRVKPSPVHLKSTKDHMVNEWGAVMVDFIESDDALGIHASEDSIICSIDKDLLQIPGYHYNFVKKDGISIGEYEAAFNLHKQMLCGDKSDNVPGYDGISRDKAPKFILKMLSEFDEAEMEDRVFNLYEDKARYLINYNLLRLWRKENDLCLPQPIQKFLTGEGHSLPEGDLTLESLRTVISSINQS